MQTQTFALGMLQSVHIRLFQKFKANYSDVIMCLLLHAVKSHCASKLLAHTRVSLAYFKELAACTLVRR